MKVMGKSDVMQATVVVGVDREGSHPTDWCGTIYTIEAIKLEGNWALQDFSAIPKRSFYDSDGEKVLCLWPQCRLQMSQSLIIGLLSGNLKSQNNTHNLVFGRFVIYEVKWSCMNMRSSMPLVY